MVPKDAATFAISLQRGADPEHADLHLHLRAKLGVSPMVVRNSRLGGHWGVEESLDQPFPFPIAPKTFLFVLTAYVDCYEIEINGASSWSYKVRDGLPISSITHLAIEAGLLIRAIHEPVESMPRNLRLNMGEGVKVGDMVFIKGHPTDEAKSFVINWQTGPGKFDDILFQLKSQVDEGKVTANCRMDDEWAKEESSRDVPIAAGAPFSLVVGVTSLGFETRLNGKEWVQFRHKHDVSNAKTLFLEGDFQPTDICIDSAQSNTPLVNGVKSRGARLQHICPELPLVSRIMGGFEKGCLFFVSGKINLHPKSFQLTVQFEEDTKDSDIALCYDIKYASDGSSKVTLNSREEDSWGQVMTVKDSEGPVPGRLFDLVIARSEDGFVCVLDGVEQITFPYQLEDQVPNHVTVSGDFDCHRLLLL